MKRLQVVFNDEAWAEVEKITLNANESFEMGSVGYSDVINEMVLASKVDIKKLQAKNINIKRSLRVLAGKEEIDIDYALKMLAEIKAKMSKKKVVQLNAEETKHA